MFNNFKYNLFHNWSFMRSLRLIIGVIALTQAAITFEILIGLVGTILLSQALLNIGCCGTSGCNTTFDKSNKTVSHEEIIYEEIK